MCENNNFIIYIQNIQERILKRVGNLLGITYCENNRQVYQYQIRLFSKRYQEGAITQSDYSILKRRAAEAYGIEEDNSSTLI